MIINRENCKNVNINHPEQRYWQIRDADNIGLAQLVERQHISPEAVGSHPTLVNSLVNPPKLQEVF